MILRDAARCVLLGCVLAAPAPARADDAACVRIDCLGECLSRADAAGKVIPELCRQDAACYRTALCARLPSGACGWIATAETRSCLQQPPR